MKAPHKHVRPRKQNEKPAKNRENWQSLGFFWFLVDSDCGNSISKFLLFQIISFSPQSNLQFNSKTIKIQPCDFAYLPNFKANYRFSMKKVEIKFICSPVCFGWNVGNGIKCWCIYLFTAINLEKYWVRATMTTGSEAKRLLLSC